MNLDTGFTTSAKDPKMKLWPETTLSKIVLWVLPPTILVLAGLVLFSSAGRDDALITYWPAHTLAESGEILNYNGDRVEQSSSLLQVLALAGLNRLTGINIVLLGHLFSIVCGALVVICTMVLSHRIDPRTAIPSGFLTATSTFLVYWSYGGLETTLQTLLVIFLVFALGNLLIHERLGAGRLALTSLTILGALTCRPEFFVVLLAVLSGILVVFSTPLLTRASRRTIDTRVLRWRIILLFTITVLLTISLFTFRQIYFDNMFPQPVIAKSFHSNLSVDILTGIKYLIKSSIVSPFAFLVSIIVAICTVLIVFSIYRKRCENSFLIISILFVSVQLSFTVFSGGDWMEGGRFLVPVVPFLSIFVSYSFLNTQISDRIRHLILSFVVALQVGGLIHFSFNKSTGIPLWDAIPCYRNFAQNLRMSEFSWFELTNRVHMRDIPMLFQLQSITNSAIDRKAERVVILSTFMGMMPYHMSTNYGPEQFHFIDTCGLVERTLTSCGVTARTPRTPFGLSIDITDYLRVLPEAQRSCIMPNPDIIVGGYRSPSDLGRVEAYGFEIVYSQEDFVKRETGLIGLGSINADKIYIGVRRELPDDSN